MTEEQFKAILELLERIADSVENIERLALENT